MKELNPKNTLQVIVEYELSDEELLRAARTALKRCYMADHFPDVDTPDYTVFDLICRSKAMETQTFDRVVLNLLNSRLGKGQ